MWIFTDKQARKFIENWLSDNREEAIKLLDVKAWEVIKKEEKPKPTKRKALMKVILINNSTDKEYTVESENDFGLTWDYPESRNGNYELVRINQYHSTDPNGWTGVARFVNFSVLKTEWKEFDIKYENETENETEKK